MTKVFAILLFAVIISFHTAHGAAIGERFHDDTKHTWTQVFKEMITPKPAKPPQFKEYTGMSKIKLPKLDFNWLYPSHL